MADASRLMLDRSTSAAARSRAFVAARLPGIDADDRYQVTLLVSELVTNAIRHGRSPAWLDLTVTGSVVRVSVHDGGQEFATRPARPRAQSAGGRGLLILDAMATAWGVAPTPGHGGKSVWFELAVSAAG